MTDPDKAGISNFEDPLSLFLRPLPEMDSPPLPEEITVVCPVVVTL